MWKAARSLPLLLLLALESCAPAPAASAPKPMRVPPTPFPTVLAEATPTAFPPAIAGTKTPGFTPTPDFPPLQDEITRSKIDRLAAWFLAKGGNPGLGIAVVVRNPRTGTLEAMLLNYGSTDKENGQPITSATVYEIGSITKPFTGILLAQAADSGTVRLDDPMQDYLPQDIHAPMYDDTPITLLNLATHYASLPRDIDTDELPEMYDWLNSYELSRPPGSEYAYSNVGFGLLGDILARLSDLDYGTLEYQSISQPLGMPDTSEALRIEQAGRLARGHTSGGYPTGYFPQSGAMSGAGYLHSTLTDMTRFLMANMQPDATPLARSLHLAQAVEAEGPNPRSGVGLGWDIDQPVTGNERLFKAGETLGFTTYISFMGDGSSGFVMLTNGMGVQELVPYMIEILGEK